MLSGFSPERWTQVGCSVVSLSLIIVFLGVLYN